MTPDAISLSVPTVAAVVPAAASALSIWPVAHWARLGSSASTIAGAYRLADAVFACEPITSPM